MGSHELKLETVVSICRTLDNLLVNSYGPNALDVLLSTSTGKLMVTSAGMTILQSLNISHPIGHMLVKSTQSHHRMTGDNSKTYLLLVHEILKNIQKRMPKDENVNRMKYCKYLNEIKRTVLQKDVLPVLAGKCHRKLHSATLNENVSEVLRSHLQGKLNRQTLEHFTQILTAFILEAVDRNPKKLPIVLRFMLDNFTVLFHENAGVSQLNSKVTPGFILTRDLLQNDTVGTKLEDVKFVLMSCSLEAQDSSTTQNAIYSGVQKDNLQKALLWKQQVAKRCVAKLRDNGVGLLVTAAYVSELVLHLCRGAGIKIMHCVDEDEIELLSQVSNVPIVYESIDIFDANFLQYIGHADVCQNVVVGGRRFVQLINTKRFCNRSDDRERRCPLDNVQSVFVCAPTPGMCSQFKSMMYNALKCLHTLTDPQNVLELHSVDEQSEAVKKDKKTCAEKEQMPIAGYSICGGGAFELYLYQFLPDCIKVNSNSSESAELNEVIKILRDSLLAVPLRLLQNSYAPAANRITAAQLLRLISTNKTNAEDTLAAELDTLDSSAQKIQGVDAKSGTALLQPNCTVVEPLASKVLMLYQVLDLVQQILRIDSVVSVTRLRPEEDSSDEENS